jgi:hypothetical protein
MATRHRREGRGKYVYAKGEQYDGEWLLDRMVRCTFKRLRTPAIAVLAQHLNLPVLQEGNVHVR